MAHDDTPFPLPPEPPLRAPESSSSFSNSGLLKPRIRPAATSGEGVPLGMSFTPPTPAPLPERGAGFFLFVSLVAALVATTFALLLAFKL